MILSFFLQTFLVLFAPFKKRTTNLLLISLLWSAHLLADWAASFAVGLISSRQGNNPSHGGGDGNVRSAFWAPFLLLHLGGPDTITAFLLEDNELWMRHFVRLVFQVLAVGYVFIQSLPSNELWVTTILLFVAGVIKYAERTRALYLASFNAFRKSLQKEPDPGFDYAGFMESLGERKKTGKQIITRIPGDAPYIVLLCEDGEILDNISAVKHAHRLFGIFKGVLVDLIIGTFERQDSEEFFASKNSADALRVISVELNFMCQVLHTKVVVVSSKVGYIFRFISFSVIVIVLYLFTSSDKSKSFYTNVDVGITYILLYGAIFLDAIAFYTLIFSEWTVATPMVQRNIGSRIALILGKYLKLKRPNWSSIEEQQTSNFLDWGRRVLFRRWSESVSCLNLKDYCLNEAPKMNHNNILHYPGAIYIKVIDVFGLKDFLDQMKYVSSKPLSKDLWDFIFKQVFEDPDDVKDAWSTEIPPGTGAFVLQKRDWNNYSSTLLRRVTRVAYAQSLLLWHVATELCYNTADDDHEGNTVDREKREFSKVLSDYMLYLLVMQPTSMMSSVAGIGLKRFQDTCAEAKRFFNQRELGARGKQKEADRRILELDTSIEPEGIRGDTYKSVLFEGCILAKELRDTFKGKKRDFMSEVWVELLANAAGHCGPKSHAQVLSRGGELISYVWLLIVHFGKAGQFRRKSQDLIDIQSE